MVLHSNWQTSSLSTAASLSLENRIDLGPTHDTDVEINEVKIIFAF